MRKLSEGYIEQWNGTWKKGFAPTRINLNKITARTKPKSTIDRAVFERTGYGHHAKQIESIIKTYFKHKKFRGLSPLLKDWRETDQIHYYIYKKMPVAVSLINFYDNDVEGSQFCWDYRHPKLKLGFYSLQRELEFYASKGYDYFYLCESTGPQDEYKTKYTGFEWFDGKWSTDKQEYICKINSV